MIFLADEVAHTKAGGQAVLGGLDALVDRNYFGSQVESFEADIAVDGFDRPFHGGAWGHVTVAASATRCHLSRRVRSVTLARV